MIPWAHPSPQPKRYVDRFTRFRARVCVQRTDTKIDHATSVHAIRPKHEQQRHVLQKLLLSC